MTAKQAFFVGDISWDTTVVVDHVPEPDEKSFTDILVEDVGGVATNAAVACFLGGGEAVLVVGIAPDPAGTASLGALVARGLRVVKATNPLPTTRAIITIDAEGEKRLVLFRGGRMYPPAELVAGFDLSDAGWVHTALYDFDAARVLVERCRQAGVRWSIDLEPATIPQNFVELADFLRGCHTVFLNARASEQLGDSAVQDLLDIGVVEVVETLGADGARVTGHGRVIHVPSALSLPVVDTTGAGDALAGWYIAGRLDGQDGEEALDTAVAAASYSVSRVGAVASYPTRAQLSLPAVS